MSSTYYSPSVVVFELIAEEGEVIENSNLLCRFFRACGTQGVHRSKFQVRRHQNA